MRKPINYARSIFILLLLVSLLAVSAVLKIMATVVTPIAVAVLLSFVFYPFCKNLKKIHIPWGMSIIITLILSIAMFYVIGTLLFTSLQAIVSAAPNYEARFTSIYKTIASTLKLPFDEDLSLVSNLLNSMGIRAAIQNIALTISSSIMSFSKVMMMVVLLIIFLLLEFSAMKNKIDVAFASSNANEKILTIVRKTITEVTHFVSIKFIISIATGLLVFLGTFVINMDFPIIWGFLAFILNFIPTFGSIISWLVTTLFALLQFYPSFSYVVYVAALVLCMNMVLGNIIEPRWEGKDLNLSPFIILVSLSFWGWMWGFVGMILSVPLMVIIKIVCENIEPLRPIAILIGGNPKKHTQEAKDDAQSKQISVPKNDQK